MKSPLSVLLATRDEEKNLPRSLASVSGLADQLLVLDSSSADRSVEIALAAGAEVHALEYEHARLIPSILQWGLDHLPIRNEWILILEADQALSPELQQEIGGLLLAPPPHTHGYYLRRRQIFRGRPIRFGGYGSKRMLKLFRRGRARLDPDEQDTRVYVEGRVGYLRHPMVEWNRKEDDILFYLGKHLRYADAFAREELRRRRGLAFQGRARLLGTPDERVLWAKELYRRLPLGLRPLLYFLWRYFVRLGILDGSNGFVFHFLQAFWFRLVVDLRLRELLADERLSGPE
jgi:glycosyltransferase involved in cell wall biosynthesis